MTDTPKPRSNAISPVVFMGSGGPDLTAPEQVERLHKSLGNIQVPEHMHGDNLAVLLCSFFEDCNGETDENGWTEEAVAGHDAVLSAIREHYDATLRAMSAKLAEAEAKNLILHDANEGLGSAAWAATDARQEAWRAGIEAAAKVADRRAKVCDDAFEKTKDPSEKCAAIEARHIARKARAIAEKGPDQ